MSTRDELAGVLADTINKQFKDMKVAYFLDGTDTTPTDIKDFVLLSMVGIFGGVANLWLGQSYKYSEVSLVTPLKYLALVFAIFFGYIIWQEVPTLKTLIAPSLVIFSTMIIFRREIYKKKIITSKTIND